jgi:hypothetical protein
MDPLLDRKIVYNVKNVSNYKQKFVKSRSAEMLDHFHFATMKHNKVVRIKMVTQQMFLKV